MAAWWRRVLQIPETQTHVPTPAELAVLPVGVHPETGDDITLAESEMMREFILVRTRAMEQELRELYALRARADKGGRGGDRKRNGA